MGISTYYNPKGSLVDNWKPKKEKEVSVDEWFSENLPHFDTAFERRAHKGLALRDPKRVHERQTGEEWQPPTEDELAHMKAIEDAEKEHLKKTGSAASAGAAAGASGGPWGALFGAGAATTRHVLDPKSTVMTSYAEDQIADEESARIDEMKSDASRLSKESAVATSRLSGDDDYLSYNYDQPQSYAGYDDWWDEVYKKS
mgnify:CR=1 FL=1|tara:strand:- start:24 stop:623 length:600 start_codon:yes stop_codon:yes gene_type:complete